MKHLKSIFTSLVTIGAFLVWSGSALAVNSQITITTKNNSTAPTITPSGLNYTGTLSSTPGDIAAGPGSLIINTGISTVTSYHIDYSTSTGGKRCHFDASSWLANAATGACTFNKAASSTGGTYATCTATITATSAPNKNSPNCSFAVTFGLQ